MTAERVLALLARLREAGVRAWVDGGFGVDALLGRQTRTHDDLDRGVALADVDAIEAALPGFERVEDPLPVRFVPRHPDPGPSDFPAVTFDTQGGGHQPQPGGELGQPLPPRYGDTAGGEAANNE